MKRHSKDCECDQCFADAVMAAVDRSIEKAARENPGKVCPFCGTNPSKPAKYGSGFKDSCGHEARVMGLVVSWKKGKQMVECINPEETRQLIYKQGKWVENPHTWVTHLWHDPNCPAWNRDRKTNKPYPHLVKRHLERKDGITYPCFCGYDGDLEFINTIRSTYFPRKRKKL